MLLHTKSVSKYKPKMIDNEIFLGMKTKRGKIIDIVENGLIDNCTVVRFDDNTVFNLFGQNLSDDEYVKNDFYMRCVIDFKRILPV